MSETGLVSLKQQLLNYNKTLLSLEENLEKINSKRNDQDFEIYRDSAIKRFEYSLKVALDLMSKYIEFVDQKINGQRLVLKKAFEFDLIEDKIWLIMIDDRNLTAHEYSEALAEELLKDIYTYALKLREFYTVIESKIDEL